MDYMGGDRTIMHSEKNNLFVVTALLKIIWSEKCWGHCIVDAEISRVFPADKSEYLVWN